MLKKRVMLHLLLICSFYKGSLSENTVPMFSLGYVSQIEYVKTFSSDSECVQTCWKKIDDGGLYEGAIVDPSYCYCTITQVGLVVIPSSSYKQIHFLFSTFKAETAACTTGSYVNFRVRLSFYLEGNDRSEIYFIDNLENPLTPSGRIIITNFIDVKRGFYTTRLNQRHNESKLYHLVEETYSGSLNTKFENFYSLATKIGDMSVVNNHTEWAVLVFANANSIWVTFNPFTISRSIQKCSLLVASSSYDVDRYIYINLNITTSADCAVDLGHVSIVLHSQQTLKFEKLIWDDLSVNATSLICEKGFNHIYVQKLYIDSFLKFSTVYGIVESSLAVGMTDTAVMANVFSTKYDYDNQFQTREKIAFNTSTELLPKKDTVQLYPTYKITNETKLENASHQCVCKTITKRQQSPCFQLEKDTGRIMFFPIQMIDAIGYNPTTNLHYGKTFRGNIVEVNLYSKNPVAIITTEKWLFVQSYVNFQMSI